MEKNIIVKIKESKLLIIIENDTKVVRLNNDLKNDSKILRKVFKDITKDKSLKKLEVDLQLPQNIKSYQEASIINLLKKSGIIKINIQSELVELWKKSGISVDENRENVIVMLEEYPGIYIVKDNKIVTDININITELKIPVNSDTTRNEIDRLADIIKEGLIKLGDQEITKERGIVIINKFEVVNAEKIITKLLGLPIFFVKPLTLGD